MIDVSLADAALERKTDEKELSTGGQTHDKPKTLTL